MPPVLLTERIAHLAGDCCAARISIGPMSAPGSFASVPLTQASARVCAVKRSHLAPLATKGFFGKCQKRKRGRLNGTCSYPAARGSVPGLAPRAATKLITTRLRESSTRGFAAVGEPNVAVCLLPGTELAFDRGVECNRGFGLLSGQINEKVARFRQINTDRVTSHRDALEFPDGQSRVAHQPVGRSARDRAAVAGLASARVPPDAFGISTRRTGCGL